MKKNLTSIAGLLLVLLLAAGCSKKEEPAAPQQPSKPAPAPAASPAAPVQKQLSSATRAGQIDFTKKTDPFKPYAAALPTPAPPPGSQQAAPPPADLLPIQSFEVNKFKLAGIIAGLQENRALVIDPNGKGYVVRAGMQIGNNNGRITRITPSTVEVVERYREGGRNKSKTIVLTLAKKR